MAIWEWNATEHGVRRADSYIAFLELELWKVAENPAIGLSIEEYPGLPRHLAKRRSRGHGHIIFYRMTDAAIEVIHLFHSAQDWNTKL